jgi:uncharacterized protein (DUF2225 family)
MVMRFLNLRLDNKKAEKETDLVYSYSWKQVECELCKEPFQDEVKTVNGKKVKLLDYP